MLTISNLRKNYGAFQLDCSLELSPGSITGLIGQNGAGKSTTFKAALGLISCDRGTIKIFGKDSVRLTAQDREHLGVVLSDSTFSEFMTVKDIAAVLKSFYKNFDTRNFLEQCAAQKLPADKKIKEFSTGMRAKLKVLAALSHRAKLLILDEPTAGLDVVARDEILELLRAYMEEDEERSIFISSHISTDLEGLCDDLYMIHDGKIILHEDTDVLLGNYGLLKVSEEQFAALDKRYLLRFKKEPYGYSCLTNQKQFYLENAPQAAMENGSIDETIFMMIKGERL